ncbi:MAG: YggS family pyridoxal phosphate-dependent enzyme [Phycisphaerales bacterium]
MTIGASGASREVGVSGSAEPASDRDSAGLIARYEEVRARVEAAAARTGRDPSRVILVAVTKYAELDDIRDLILHGHRDFGENRVQQLTQRAAMLDEWVRRRRSLGGSTLELPRWHMIGHLQRNKSKKVAEAARLIHSVDSLRLAEELQTIGLKREQPVDVLIQVNVSNEESKFGCPVPAAEALAQSIESMAYLRCRGLMTMAPYADDPEASRPHFARLRDLFDDMTRTGYGEGQFNLLSMGMSNDFEVAIEEGANIVRVGSSIFGERETTDDDDLAEG